MSLAEVMRTMKNVYEGKEPSPEWARSGKRAFASRKALDEWASREPNPSGTPSASDKNVSMREVAAFVKLISGNEDLLKEMAKTNHASIAELADELGRAPSNVARTLKKLELYGIVKLKPGPSRSKQPVLERDEVDLRVNFRSGRMSLVA
jgi:predicted transcriptional regulator